ncbi:MAG: FliH/SctL family protein [Marinisporobacter sp.]|nr:FliH/SctL family protein [Marinisporobacter sp.]
MSRIFKSSYVQVGDMKEIRIQNNSEDSLEVHVEQQEHEAEEIKEPEIDFEEIYNQKMQEIEELAKKKLEEADRQAQTIIGDAYEDAKKIHENAKSDGFAQGKAEGYGIGKAEGDKIVKEALNIKNEILMIKKEFVSKMESEGIDLIIDTVERILNMKIEDSYETIIGLVKAALSKCAYTESLVLRVSPDDYGYAISAKDKILTLAENVDDISIKQDPSLKKGSCILDTVSGSIDSSIQTQFHQIKSLFEEILESE